MTDLFRGYDLTSVVDKVAEASWERILNEARQRGYGKEVKEWNDLGPIEKHNYKGTLLPLITDVLNALESDQVQPTEAKVMYVYGFEGTNVSGHDPRFYENVDTMHSLDTCTVWALHMHVHPSAVNAMLERAAVLTETTGEYTYGDSWTEWGEETEDDADRHQTVYFVATPARAKDVGDHIANSLTVAGVRALGGDMGNVPAHAISTSGDYAEQIKE